MKIKKYIPTVLTCIGVVGLIGTAVLSGKAAIKAHDILEKQGADVTKTEKIKAVLPVYIPTIVTGGVTIACIVGSNVLNKRQQVALIGAYTALNKVYADYKNKVVEQYGEEAHDDILKAIAAEQPKDVHLTGECLGTICWNGIEDTGEKVLFYDEYSKRYFETTALQVTQAEYHVNRNFCLGDAVTLNDFYSFLGLTPTKEGDALGWYMGDDCIFWVDFNHRKVTLDDGLECYILEMAYAPAIMEI